MVQYCIEYLNIRIFELECSCNFEAKRKAKLLRSHHLVISSCFNVMLYHFCTSTQCTSTRTLNYKYSTALVYEYEYTVYSRSVYSGLYIRNSIARVIIYISVLYQTSIIIYTVYYIYIYIIYQSIDKFKFKLITSTIVYSIQCQLLVQSSLVIVVLYIINY